MGDGRRAGADPARRAAPGATELCGRPAEVGAGHGRIPAGLGRRGPAGRRKSTARPTTCSPASRHLRAWLATVRAWLRVGDRLATDWPRRRAGGWSSNRSATASRWSIPRDESAWRTGPGRSAGTTEAGSTGRSAPRWPRAGTSSRPAASGRWTGPSARGRELDEWAVGDVGSAGGRPRRPRRGGRLGRRRRGARRRDRRGPAPRAGRRGRAEAGAGPDRATGARRPGLQPWPARPRPAPPRSPPPVPPAGRISATRSRPTNGSWSSRLAAAATGGENDSPGVRALAESLADASAGPRDVVEVHSTALRQRSLREPRPGARRRRGGPDRGPGADGPAGRRYRARAAPAGRRRRGAAGDRPGGASDRAMGRYMLKLYVTGQTARSHQAIANLRRICEVELGGRYEMVVIDVLERPQLAEDEKILATPTVVKELPLPMRRIIGDLSDPERVLVGLDLRSFPRAEPGLEG